MTHSMLARVYGACLLACLSLSTEAQAEGAIGRGLDLVAGLGKTQLALIGDMPYRDADIEKLDEVIREINASRMDFTVHTGDIKSGGSLCSDELLKARFVQLQKLKRPKRHPLFAPVSTNKTTG